MKKILTFMILTIISLSVLTGCGGESKVTSEKSQATEEATQKKNVLTDADFVVNLAKGLESRWDWSNSEENSDTDSMSTSEYQNFLRQCIKCEKDELGSLDSYQFEDTKLKELAEQYYKGLDLQEEGIQYAGTDSYSDYSNTYELGYSYRTVSMYNIYMEFGLTVDKKHQTTLDDFLAEYPTENKRVILQDYINELVKTIKYKIDKDNTDEYSIYLKAVIENTTEYDISSLEINVDYLDASGVVIYQTTDYINDFKAGSKVQSQIHFDKDKGSYESIDVSLSYYWD